MSDFSKFYRSASETLHKALFSLHDDVYFRALERVRVALSVLHEIETQNQDMRPTCRQYIVEFELLRSKLEDIGTDAMNFRSRLIRENGCDGNCGKGLGKV